MNIRYLGHSCFFIEGDFSVVTDPFADIGYKQEVVSADYCLISHGHFDHNAAENVRGAVVIDRNTDPGKAKAISLKEIFTYHDAFSGTKRGMNLVFKFVVDGVTFCHMGDLGENFSVETADRIGKCDVLFVPVGGNYTIDYKNAKKFADYIAPKIVVPMHFKTPRSRIDIDGIEKFKSLYKLIIEVNDVFSITKREIDEIKEGGMLSFNTDRF